MTTPTAVEVDEGTADLNYVRKVVSLAAVAVAVLRDTAPQAGTAQDELLWNTVAAIKNRVTKDWTDAKNVPTEFASVGLDFLRGMRDLAQRGDATVGDLLELFQAELDKLD